MEKSVGQKIKERRLACGLTLMELSEMIGVYPGTISKWERGEIKTVKNEDLVKLADALRCNILWLMDLDDAITVDENYEEILVDIPELEEVPVIGEIACGKPVLAEENYDGFASVPRVAKADFALRCKGESMINARIFPGDLVFIRKDAEVESGDIAAVLIDGEEATLKRIYRYANRLELRPENPLFEVLQFEGEQQTRVRILGKAVSFYSLVR